MNQVEEVKRICKERKISIHKLEVDCGFANGYISQLKKGVFPSDRLQKIADYLGISINHFVQINKIVTVEEPEIITLDIPYTPTLSKEAEEFLKLYEAAPQEVRQTAIQVLKLGQQKP